MSMPRIIGITGYAQHGKNTIADALEGWGWTPVAFADGLRELVSAIDPYVFCDYPQRYASVVQERGYEAAKHVREVRRLLQATGLACRDIFGEEAWVNALDHSLFSDQPYVITDVRFPNEAAYIKDMGGELWKVVRPNFDNEVGTDHPSERYIRDMPFNRMWVNDSTVEGLQGRVDDHVEQRQGAGLLT